MSAIMHDDRPNATKDRPERVCDQCGYSLAGLQDVAKCPECGAPTRRSSGISVRDATMSVEAPAWFVRWIRNGVYLCSVSIIAMLGAFVVGILSPILSAVFFLGGIGAWAGGVWMFTRPRAGIGDVTKDAVLDSEPMRRWIRLSVFAYPLYVILIVIAAATGPALIDSRIYNAMAGLVGLVAWIGLIPTCIYLAELAHWATDETTADRLRATAWTMGVFGALSALFSILGVPFFAFWCWVVIFFATVYFLIKIIRFGSMLGWVLRHQEARAGSFDRVKSKIERRMDKPTSVVDMNCLACGYPLDGLPFGGSCPECGESYAERTPNPIRDPALRSKRDESLIPLSQPEPPAPLVDVPDEGSIPLIDDGQDPAQADPDEDPAEGPGDTDSDTLDHDKHRDGP